jgi:serine O-acetyltransferase
MVRQIAKIVQHTCTIFYRWIYFGIYNSIVAADFRLLFSCVISQRLPRSTRLPHPVGIVIGSGTPIGDGCTILQNTTIGVKELDDSRSPRIGNNVIICSGAAVLGDIEVGNNAVIAANSVVLSDVPEGTVVAGVPAERVDADGEEL